jgi:dTDP-4-amino-4,6-dideoxygalactose transaminase
MRKHIVFGKPQIDKKEKKNLIKVMNSGWIGTGPLVEKFEKKFKEYKNSKYSISLNSCTAALHLSLICLGIKKNDEIITTPLTFCSTVNSIIHAGGTPILADIDPKTLNIDVEKIEQKITRKTKAIILVHFAGLPCDIEKICNLAKKYNLKIIEDCAHAIEAKYKKKDVGNFGDVGCFSFYVNKNITTGEGGMAIMKSKQIEQKFRFLRLHGISKDAWKRHSPESLSANTKYQNYDLYYPGFKFNMIDIQASIGLAQLTKIKKFWLKRKKIYDNYSKKLIDLPIKFQQKLSVDYKHAYHLFVFHLDKEKTKKNRTQLINYLSKNKIGFGIHYKAINDLHYYKKKYQWNKATAPIAFEISQNIISLPLYPNLKKNQMEYIIKKLKNFF